MHVLRIALPDYRVLHRYVCSWSEFPLGRVRIILTPAAPLREDIDLSRLLAFFLVPILICMSGGVGLLLLSARAIKA